MRGGARVCYERRARRSHGDPPLHVDIAQDALDDLRRRIAATNWPEK
jgi:hypothetical protein